MKKGSKRPMTSFETQGQLEGVSGSLNGGKNQAKRLCLATTNCPLIPKAETIIDQRNHIK